MTDRPPRVRTLRTVAIGDERFARGATFLASDFGGSLAALLAEGAIERVPARAPSAARCPELVARPRGEGLA